MFRNNREYLPLQFCILSHIPEYLTPDFGVLLNPTHDSTECFWVAKRDDPETSHSLPCLPEAYRENARSFQDDFHLTEVIPDVGYDPRRMRTFDSQLIPS